MQQFCYKYKDCNFSYAGLESSVYRHIEKELKIAHNTILVGQVERKILKESVIANICAAVQVSITLQLVIK